MCKLYTLQHNNRTFAIVLGRAGTQETLRGIRTAINDEFNCDCNIGHIELDHVRHDTTKTLHVTTGAISRNIGVSQARLY